MTGARGDTVRGVPSRTERVICSVLADVLFAGGTLTRPALDRAAAMAAPLFGRQRAAKEIESGILLASPLGDEAGTLPDDVRRRVLRAAAAVACVDGRIASAELACVRQMARALRVPAPDLWPIMAEFLRDLGALPPALSDAARASLVLGVEAWASPEDVRAAYRAGMARYHPDRGAEDRRTTDADLRIAQDLNWAYDHLVRRTAGD
jgi:DnaJ-domain-containing protein 1